MSLSFWLTMMATAAGIHTGMLLLLAMAEWLRPAVPRQGSPRPFTVIVAAHNEAANLQRLIPALLNQNYFGPTEVLIALDRCTDDSLATVQSFAAKNQSLRFIEIKELPEGLAPKKYAIQQAIAAARYPYLAFTDADCLPGTDWLQHVHDHFTPESQLVLGISPYERRPGVLNQLIRYETFVTAFLYTNAARIGLPWMAVGRNLAYRKAFFEKAGGFGGHEKRLSGDDDLLVNQHAQRHQTAVMTARGSEVPSLPALTWGQWLRQKMRHVSASTAYRPASLLFISFLQGSHGLFYLSLTVSLAMGASPATALVIYGARLLFLFLLYLPAAAHWRDASLMLFLPLGDFLMAVYLFTVVPAGLILKPKWIKS